MGSADGSSDEKFATLGIREIAPAIALGQDDLDEEMTKKMVGCSKFSTSWFQFPFSI